MRGGGGGTEIRREEQNCKVARARVGLLRTNGRDHRLLACEKEIDLFTKRPCKMTEIRKQKLVIPKTQENGQKVGFNHRYIYS